MEPPVPTYPDSVRDEKVKVFRAIRPLSPEDLVRGHTPATGRRRASRPIRRWRRSRRVRLHIDSWRWEGVPFFIRAGKRLATSCTEVLVTLKRPPLRRRGPGGRRTTSVFG